MKHADKYSERINYRDAEARIRLAWFNLDFYFPKSRKVQFNRDLTGRLAPRLLFIYTVLRYGLYIQSHGYLPAILDKGARVYEPIEYAASSSVA